MGRYIVMDGCLFAISDFQPIRHSGGRHIRYESGANVDNSRGKTDHTVVHN